MRLGLLLVIGAAACGDDLSVMVDVTHPVPVFETTISVYESDAITCDAIEFGDVDEAALLAALVAEEKFDKDGRLISGDLDGLSRTKDKAIVARGYDESGTLLTAACVTKGVVHGKDRVPITTDAAAIVSSVADQADPYTLAVLVTRPDGTPAPNRKVSWHVYAPIGTKSYNTSITDPAGDSEWRAKKGSCTNSNGIARIHPVGPDLIGGFATRVRTSWAANALPLQSALSKATVAPTTIRPPVGVKNACAIRVSGTTKRLVCLDSDLGGNPVARELTVTVSAGGATISPVGAPTSVTNPLGLLAVPGATAGDQGVYAIDTSGHLQALFGAAPPTATLCHNGPSCTDQVSGYVFAPDCDGAGTESTAHIYLRVTYEQMPNVYRDSIKEMLPNGGIATEIRGFAVENLDQIELTGAGCITQITAGQRTARQVVVYEGTAAGLTLARAFYNCAGLRCSKVVLPFAAGVTFVRTRAMPIEDRLVGASVDATGVVISSWVMLPDSDPDMPDRLIEHDRVPAAALPRTLLADYLDGDDGYDLVWDLDGKRGGTSLEIAYSRMAGDQRLEAVTTAPAIVAQRLLLGDVDGDSHAEIVLVGEPSTGGVAPLVVIPTNVPPATTMTVMDDCK